MAAPKHSSALHLKPVWRPTNIATTPMDRYRRHINAKFSQDLRTAHDLHAWTVANPQLFWLDVYDYINMVPPLPADTIRAYDSTIPMSSVPEWFEGVRLNYAANVLVNAERDPAAIALIGIREGQDLDGEKVTWGQLRERVRVVRSALVRSGVKEGERVAALVSTSIWAVVLFLASASMGAVFTSISPDLGIEGCVSRLQQVTPSVLFADTDATYKGRRTSVVPKIEKILEQLKSKPKVFLIPISVPASRLPSIERFLALSSTADELTFARLPFKHPLLICYSSGTTGTPKCIVHQQGLILNSKKTSILHNSLGPSDIVMQYSSTSWVVFYVMMGHFSTGATSVLYDGSPLWPDAKTLMKVLEKHRATYFGTSPRYLLELEMSKTTPKTEFDLSALRMVNTTGAPLSTEQYGWFYQAFPSKVQISNTAGGTDTATSLIATDPTGPLYPGEMQMLALGMDVDIADPETGESTKHTGRAGEMVIRQPFPSMPVFFWGDEGNKIYRSSYFERFPNLDVWAQHDWLSHNAATKGFVMTGRSDGVLNPSGIRFGSGEIYAIVEGPLFNSEIAETLCVGRRRPQDRDEVVFLFVKMSAGKRFDDRLQRRLREAISTGLSPRHVPRFMIEVDEIPVTINGKKVEIAVKQIISGRDVKPSSTVLNPDCLRAYKRFVNVEAQRTSRL